MSNSPLILSNDILELELSPSIGGSISAFRSIADGRRTAVLRESHTPLDNVLDASSFPLVPFVNRIRGGCFEFRGRRVELSANMAGDPSPLHGQGWLNPWRVESTSPTEARLLFEHEPGEWPWSYSAMQRFTLAGDSLHIRISCRNTSADPMPCGLGIHPYFRCSASTRIQTQVEEVWTIDDRVLPVGRAPATGRYAIGDDPACGRGLDNGYGGWSGCALLTDPDWPFEIVLTSPQARFFQLYSPEAGGIFVAEPVTHANGALNEPQTDWPSLGLRVLAPGDEQVLDAQFEVQPKAPLAEL